MGTPLADMDSLRHRVLATLDDCGGGPCERVRGRVLSTRDAQDLWLLRCEVFQQVASRHCQAEAAARINSLLPLFEGRLPERMLVAV
jgi:hypothetical protein